MQVCQLPECRISLLTRLHSTPPTHPRSAQDLDPVSFVRHAARPWWQRALGLPGQQVGLMAQGLQRGLDSAGRVRALAQPSALLADALGPDTLVFLSGA